MKHAIHDYKPENILSFVTWPQFSICVAREYMYSNFSIYFKFISFYNKILLVYMYVY